MEIIIINIQKNSIQINNYLRACILWEREMHLKDIIQKLHFLRSLKRIYHKIQNSYGINSMALGKIKKDTKCIFQVIGVPRSGTTILTVGLDSMQNIVCLSEPHLLWLKEGYFYYNPKKYSGNQNWVKVTIPPHKLIGQVIDNNKINFVGFKETFREKAHPYPSENFIKSNVRKRNVDFTVCIIRDPRDIWISTNTRYGFINPMPITSNFVNRWNIFCRMILIDSLFFVKYEDLVRDTEKTFRLITQYLGCDFDHIMLEPPEKKGGGDKKGQSGGKIQPYSVGRYKEEMDYKTRHYIEKMCGKFMKVFRYL